MKKVLLSGAVAFVAFSAMAQSTSLAGRANATSVNAVPFANQPNVFAPTQQPSVNVDKDGPNTYYISYADYNTSDAVSGTLDGGRFVINPNAAPLDSEITSISVGFRPYVGFSDFNDVEGSYMESNAAAPGAKLRIDSLSVLLGHSNASGTTNKIYGFLTGAQSVTFGAPVGQQYVSNNTVFWADSITTTTSLSPSGSAFGANSNYVWDMAPGYVHSLSNTNHICFRLMAVMGAGDTLGISGFYKADGNGDPVDPLIWNSFARQSQLPNNIYVFPVNWNVVAKVTYTSNASLNQLDANGFTIHSFMPNPANAATTIRYELKTPSDVTFVVTDMTGKQVDMVQLKGQATGTFNYELNTSAYASGFYNVTMRVNNQVYTQKLNVVK